MNYKSGFVAIIGRPNVGKSSLLNKLLGYKVVITSSKPQTTRNSIKGILSGENYQIIFIDTPGIHKPRNELGQYMVRKAEQSLNEVDAVLFLTDEGGLGGGDKHIIKSLRNIQTPIILAINKIDLVTKDEVNQLMETYQKAFDFDDIIPISVLKDENLDTLLDSLIKLLPEGPQYYPDEMVTDQPERFILGELIREKVLELTEEEVPHGVAVEVEEIQERENEEMVYVRATVYCEKKSHKGILIGKGGRMLKQIGKNSRKEIEKLLGTKIFLDLWIKVKKNWRKNQAYVKNLGYKD